MKTLYRRRRESEDDFTKRLYRALFKLPEPPRDDVSVRVRTWAYVRGLLGLKAAQK